METIIFDWTPFIRVIHEALIGGGENLVALIPYLMGLSALIAVVHVWYRLWVNDEGWNLAIRMCVNFVGALIFLVSFQFLMGLMTTVPNALIRIVPGEDVGGQMRTMILDNLDMVWAEQERVAGLKKADEKEDEDAGIFDAIANTGEYVTEAVAFMGSYLWSMVISLIALYMAAYFFLWMFEYYVRIFWQGIVPLLTAPFIPMVGFRPVRNWIIDTLSIHMWLLMFKFWMVIITKLNGAIISWVGSKWFGPALSLAFSALLITVLFKMTPKLINDLLNNFGINNASGGMSFVGGQGKTLIQAGTATAMGYVAASRVPQTAWNTAKGSAVGTMRAADLGAGYLTGDYQQYQANSSAPRSARDPYQGVIERNINAFGSKARNITSFFRKSG